MPLPLPISFATILPLISPITCSASCLQWANALSVTAIEQLLGEDCDAEAEAAHRQRLAQREVTDGAAPGYDASIHQVLESSVQWDGKYDESKVEAWKGIGYTI